MALSERDLGEAGEKSKHANERQLLALLMLMGIKILIANAEAEVNIKQLVRSIEQANAVPNNIEICHPIFKEQSIVYCEGKLLEAVNVHKLFPDSKTFVDMPMKKNAEDVMKQFDLQFHDQEVRDINKEELSNFIDEYFSEPGEELEYCALTNWLEQPPLLKRIPDEAIRDWAYDLHKIWKKLCRRIKANLDLERYSIIEVPEDFIVPGGRYREYFYWDAYWIIKGLLASNLHANVRKIILNYKHCIEKLGYVPTGGRIYYSKKSQPPMFVPMIYEYYESTRDLKFLESVIETAKKEILFWVKHRTQVVTVGKKQYTLFRYFANSTRPRPEAFRNDLIVSMNVPVNKKAKFFRDIASAGESGWDFSSRWFKDQMTMETIETTDIFPVDLNALMCWNFAILEYFYLELGRLKPEKYNTEEENARLWVQKLMEAMKNVFYDAKEGSWFDYNSVKESINRVFYTANAMPLFTNCYDTMDLNVSQNFYDYMQRTGAMRFINGIPASLIENTNQQWDFPNGWGPQHHMIIEGMRKSQNPEIQHKAFLLAEKWVLTNYQVYRETGYMWDKYNVHGFKVQPGGGGEFGVELGYGFTNGAVLDLLVTYYDQFHYEEPKGKEEIIEVPQEDVDSGTKRQFIEFYLLTTIVGFYILLISYHLI